MNSLARTMLVVLTIVLLPQSLQARWYDAEAGVWLTRDPAGYRDGPNPYAYTASRPIRHVDPTGLVTVSFPCEKQSEGGRCRDVCEHLNKDKSVVGYTDCDNRFCCICDQQYEFANTVNSSQGMEIITRCATRHEKFHIRWCDRPLPRALSECLAYGIEMDCLNRAFSECRTEACKNAVLHRMEEIEELQKAECKEAAGQRP
jgi:hypothetical protein